MEFLITPEQLADVIRVAAALARTQPATLIVCGPGWQITPMEIAGIINNNTIYDNENRSGKPEGSGDP